MREHGLDPGHNSRSVDRAGNSAAFQSCGTSRIVPGQFPNTAAQLRIQDAKTASLFAAPHCPSNLAPEKTGRVRRLGSALKVQSARPRSHPRLALVATEALNRERDFRLGSPRQNLAE